MRGIVFTLAAAAVPLAPLAAQDSSIRPLQLGQSVAGQLAPGDYTSGTILSDNPVYVDRYLLPVAAGQRVHLSLSNSQLPAKAATIIVKGQSDDQKVTSHSSSLGSDPVRAAFTSSIAQQVLVQVTTPFGPAQGAYRLNAVAVATSDPGAPPVTPYPFNGHAVETKLAGSDWWADGEVVRDYSFEAKPGEMYAAHACCMRDSEYLSLSFIGPDGETIYDDRVPMFDDGDEPGWPADRNTFVRTGLVPEVAGTYRLRLRSADEFRTGALALHFSMGRFTRRAASASGGSTPTVAIRPDGEPVAGKFTDASRYHGTTQSALFTATIPAGKWEVWVRADSAAASEISAEVRYPGGSESDGGDDLILLTFDMAQAGPIEIEVDRDSEFFTMVRGFTVELQPRDY